MITSWAILTLFPLNILAHSETQVIEMTSSGFFPDLVTVDTNNTLIFVNKDTKERWPASNVHPTHDLYPEFDPARPIKPGESWTFKPKKAGEWKFHDHLNPHMKGVLQITKENPVESPVDGKNNTGVADKFKEWINSIITKLKNVFSFKNEATIGAEEFIKLPPDKQFEELKTLAENSTSKKAWEFIKTAYTHQSGSSGNIHDLAHLSGKLIFEKDGFDGLKNCSPEFAFGCYHGFLDTAFKKDLTYLNEAYEGCLQLGQPNSGPAASCIHGIGHGVASFYQTADLNKSLSSCRNLATGAEYCFDGVFMEFVRNAPDTFFKKNDPLYPCNELEQKFGPAYSFACGRNQPGLLMGRFKLGFEEVVNICLSSDSKQLKGACFDSLGFSLASGGEVEQIINNCQKINETEYVTRCIKAAAGELVFQEVPGWYEKSKTVCQADTAEIEKCLEHVNRLINEYGRKIKISFRTINPGEDENSYIRQQMKQCYETGGRDGCYKDAAQVLYNQLGLSKTLRLLKANEDYQEVYARCHEVTHYLSRFEYAKQKNISKVYAQCDSTCHGGCYHGTLEAYLKESLGFVQSEDVFSKVSGNFAKICGEKKDYQKPIEFNECMHGLGHAAMFVTEMELKQSLKLCDNLQDQDAKERCYSGVFMENSSSSTSFDHKSIYIKADDPFYPCNILEEKYQALCWQYQSSYFAIITNQDWEKVASMCLQVPDNYQDLCFKTIGTNQVGFAQDLLTMKNDCGLMPDNHFKNTCIAGVVSSLSYRFVGDAQKIINFCSLVDLENQESCYKQMGTGISDWTVNKDLARKECDKISNPNGVAWCLGAI